MTHEEAKNLKHGDEVYFYNPTFAILKWRVNGKVKLWKSNPERIRVPIKHGLYEYGAITENNLQQFHLNHPHENA